MKTLLFASALLLSAAGADGSPGGSPNEPDPNLNDAGAAPQPESIGAPEPDPAVNGGPSTTDFTEADVDFQKRLEAERAEFEKIRELTPVQEVELRAIAGASHLGVIIGTPDGIRCVALADWRTDRLCLKAGDNAHIVVLAGEGLKTWEFYRGQEARAKDQAARAGAAPAVDPLEETLPADGGTKAAEGETKAANPETTAAAQGS